MTTQPDSCVLNGGTIYLHHPILYATYCLWVLALPISLRFGGTRSNFPTGKAFEKVIGFKENIQ